MNICFFALSVDSLSYTVIKAITHSNNRVFLLTALGARGNSDVGLAAALAKDPLVTVMADESTPIEGGLDRLIIQGHPRLTTSEPTFSRLAAAAPRLTLITAGDRSRRLRQAIRLQRRERQWLKPWRRKIDTVIYKDGFYPIDRFRFGYARKVAGFDVHSQFLEDPASFEHIHGYNWQAQAERPILANFLGSKDPRIRERVLDSIRPMLAPDGARDSEAKPGKQWFWHEYTDAAPGGLGPLEFVDLLTDSDFTLCPPGYSLVTHRPIEALLRGSIPVLNANELDIYAIGLADGVNCIAAPIGDWSTVIDRLLAMDQDRIAAMRRHIGEMHATLLDYPAGARNMCRRLGIAD